MKKEINMRKQSGIESKKTECNSIPADMKADNAINTDPDGMWTGVSTVNRYEKPVQDVDDL